MALALPGWAGLVAAAVVEEQVGGTPPPESQAGYRPLLTYSQGHVQGQSGQATHPQWDGTAEVPGDW